MHGFYDPELAAYGVLALPVVAWVLPERFRMKDIGCFTLGLVIGALIVSLIALCVVVWGFLSL